jgi:hypothetical protein
LERQNRLRIPRIENIKKNIVTNKLKRFSTSSNDFINSLVENEIKNFTVDVHFIAKE